MAFPRRTWIILWPVVVLLGCWNAGAWADARLVRVAVYDFNPLCRTEGLPSGEHCAGLFPAILEEVARQEKWSLQFVAGSLPECLERLEAGQVDLVVAATYSNEAARRFRFTRETVISTWAQVYISDSARIESLLDLAGRTVGVVRDDPYIGELRRLVQGLNIQCTFVEFNTYEEVLRALENKWTDTGVVDRIYATLHEENYRVQRTPLIFSPVELRFAAARDRGQALTDALDYHLAALKHDPASLYYRQLETILSDDGEQRHLERLKRSLIATGGLLLLATGVSLILRRQVRIKTAQLHRTNLDLQEQLRQRLQAEAVALRLMGVIEQSEDCILITDPAGRVEYANVAFQRLTHQQHAPALELPPPFLERLPAAGAPAHEIWRGRLLYEEAAETVYELETTLSPVFSGDGDLTHYGWVCHDVTNEVRMERHLRQAQKMEAIGTLAGGIAHDFNNILSPIIGYTELVRRSLPAESPQRTRLTSVLESANRARELVQQILSFSRRREETSHPLRITPIVKETLRLLRASLPATIEIRQQLEPCPGLVRTNATQIHQVLMNLCTNAYHAMREGGGVLNVEAAQVMVGTPTLPARLNLPAGEYIRLTIADTGRGMDRATLERIYDPYFTTKAPGEGTGLGLFLVHGIVRSSHGHIEVASEVGKGTTFQVYLPVAEAVDEALQPASAPVASAGGSGHILVVDDEVAITGMLEQVLSDLGYDVTTSNNSLRALEIVRAAPGDFDLVITDQTMPNLAGVQLAERLHALRADLPIMLCSGYCEGLTEAHLQTLGICRLVEKPFNPATFSQLVREVLQQACV